jgi:hypothetical protein
MIKHYNRIKQILDFRNIGNSKIHPSDIDAILEFDNKYLIIFECKLKGVSVPLGQKILFERIVDCWQKTNGEAFIVYCEHNTSTDEVITMHNSTVVNVYHNKKNENRNENLKQFLIKLANHYKITKLKNALND